MPVWAYLFGRLPSRTEQRRHGMALGHGEIASPGQFDVGADKQQLESDLVIRYDTTVSRITKVIYPNLRISAFAN
jgi:hypothetical protein